MEFFQWVRLNFYSSCLNIHFWITGQFLSASLIKELTPGHMICGTGADVIFKVPVMRQIMAWLGTHPANRSNISKIFQKGYHCAIMPGGIAEMYLVSEKAENVFLLKRRNTVKVAIQEGATIVVLFAFGNTRLFKVAGEGGSQSWLSSRSPSSFSCAHQAGHGRTSASSTVWQPNRRTNWLGLGTGCQVHGSSLRGQEAKLGRSTSCDCLSDRMCLQKQFCAGWKRIRQNRALLYDRHACEYQGKKSQRKTFSYFG